MPAKNEVRLLALSDESKDNVEAVSKLLTEQNIKNTWVSSEDVLSVNDFEDDVIYVADPTEGKEVDYLVKKGFSIIGPQCALTVLKHNILLKNDLKYPVHNLTMMGCLICFSNIEPKKRLDLRGKVERMGGKVTGLLTQDVTHLVVKEVGSVKYFSAAHAGISIMTMDWIEHLWKHGQSRYVSAKDGKWEEFKCPIFLGCCVCVTGFNTAERNRIQKLVTKFGGIYSGAMKLDFTTHLIVYKPEGQKYMMAGKFGVKVVNVDWINKSVEKGWCQDHSRFPVKPTKSVGLSSKPHSSTPERNDAPNNIPSLHDLSNISMATVNESVVPTMGDVSTLSAIGLPHNATAMENGKRDLLAFPISNSYDGVLDGMSVYLLGFSMREEEKLKQLISISGATRYNQLTSSVSHVIIGSSSTLPQKAFTAIQTALRTPDRELWVVSYKWLLASLKKTEVVAEFDYWVDSVAQKPALDQSDNPVSEFADDADQTTFVEPQRTTQVEAKDQGEAAKEPNISVMHDVISQYMGDPLQIDEEGDSTLLRNFAMKDDAEQGGDDTPHLDDEDNNEAAHGDEKPFRNKTFIVLGFDEDDTNNCIDLIEALDGRIVPSYSKKIVDYAVVPLTGCPVERTVMNVVTDYWIDLCTSEERLVDIASNPMCAPFSIPGDAVPLQGCVTCLSKYQEPERSHLVHLMEELGAFYQDNVARKDMPPVRRTTHLIVVEPEGDKFVGSKKWGIHTITAEWVFECARKGKRVPESNFLVDKVTQKDTSFISMAEPCPTNSRTSDEVNNKNTCEAITETKGFSSDHSKLEFPPMPRPPSVVDHIRRKLEAKAEAQRAQLQQTPLREKVLRLNTETPNKVIFIGANPNISFQLDEVFALLKTPVNEQKRIKEAMKSNPETPLSEFVERFLTESLRDVKEIGADLAANLEKVFDAVSTDEDEKKSPEKEMKADEVAQESAAMREEPALKPPLPVKSNETVDAAPVVVDEKPLKDVVLYVCKKLSKQKLDLNVIVAELGGEFRWTYDNACTHFVFQGKQNDTNREFRTARSNDKWIVSPYWVAACKDAKCRVNESDYPHVYNPNRSIQMVSTASQLGTRRTTRSSIVDQSISRSLRSTLKSSTTDSDDTKPVTRKVNKKAAEGSQEVRDSLKKTLENIMSSTSRQLLTNRPGRLSCSTGSISSPPHLVPPRIPPNSGETAVTNKPTSDADKPESSQDVHVVWDDPIGREEMERILKEQSGRNSSEDVAEALSEQCNAPPASEDQDQNVKMTCSESNGNMEQSKVEESKIADDCLSQIIREGRKPAFLISSVTPQQRVEYASIIENLGGSYLERDCFDTSCTHLIVMKPARNEKFLASLSSGKWILHTSYIEACKEAGVFLKEDSYEYGNPLSSWSSNNDTEASLIAAAHRWRKIIFQRKLKGEKNSGAFSDWKVLLHVSDRQTPGFVRLLESGSGQVVARSLPYKGDLSDLTHAIIDPNRLKQLPWSEVENLHRAGIHCCIPEYIADFLMKHPQPNVEELYLPAIKTLLNSEDTSEAPKKRRKVN